MQNLYKYFYLVLFFTNSVFISSQAENSAINGYSDLKKLDDALYKAINAFDINETRKIASQITSNDTFNSLSSSSCIKSNILFLFKQGFIRAAKEGHTAFMLELLQIQGIKFDVNEFDGAGRCALLYTAARGDVNTVRKLLNIPEINVNRAAVIDYEGHTALMEAAKRGDLDMVKELLKAPKLDINYSTYPCRETALMIALPRKFEPEALYKNKKMIVLELLQVPGINIRQTDLNGFTALDRIDDFFGDADIKEILLKMSSKPIQKLHPSLNS